MPTAPEEPPDAPPDEEDCENRRYSNLLRHEAFSVRKERPRRNGDTQMAAALAQTAAKIVSANGTVKVSSLTGQSFSSNRYHVRSSAWPKRR